MAMQRTLYPILVALAATAPISAQLPPPGTIVISMQMKLPDSVKVPLPIGNSIDLQISIMTDGRRVAADLAPGPGMTLWMLPGIRLHALYAPGADTIHAGILFPAEMAAAAGGASGYRFDIPLSTLDSLRRANSHTVDSIIKKLTDSIGTVIPHPAYRSLGVTATVAGITCEEWETIVAMDTTRLCLIPTPALIRAVQDYVKRISGAEQWMDRLPGLADAAKEAFGGRDMTPIRTVNVKTGLRIELVSYTPGVPDAARFDLPPNLQPLPGGLGIKPPGGGSGIDRR